MKGIDLSSLHHASILMTGGTGFIGTAMLEAFRQSDVNAQVYVTTRRPGDYADEKDKRIHYISRNGLGTKLPNGITDIVHLEPDTDYRSTITKDLAALAAMASIRILYASSGAAYCRRNWYGRAKLAAESLLKSHGLSLNLPFVVCRLWAFIGPHLPLVHYAAGEFIRDGLAGGPIVVQGDGRAIRSYLYTTDIAEWMWTILQRGRLGGTYNVGSLDAVSIAQLAQEIAQCFKCGVKFLNDPLAGDVRYVPGSIPAQLGLTQKVDRQEAIDKTVAWYRKRQKQS